MAADAVNPELSAANTTPVSSPSPAGKQHDECHARAEPPRGGPTARSRPSSTWSTGVVIGGELNFHEAAMGTSQRPVRRYRRLVPKVLLIRGVWTGPRR